MRMKEDHMRDSQLKPEYHVQIGGGQAARELEETLLCAWGLRM
jgi:hypothetical protein